MASFGMFGGAAPRIRRLQPAQVNPLQYAPQLPQEEVAPAAMGAFGQGPVRRKESAPPAASGAAAQGGGTPKMGAFGQGPAKPAYQKIDWWKEISGDPLRFLLRGTDGIESDVAGQAAAEASAQRQAQVAAQIDTLRRSGVPDAQIVAFMNNPEKWSEEYASNVAAANVAGGDSRYVNGKLVTAPKYGEADGFLYSQGPDGMTWGDQRDSTHAETETNRHNRATEANARDRLAYDKSKPTAMGGLTPYQGLNFQFKLDDLDRELEGNERKRRDKLAALDNSISLIDDFMDPKKSDRFNAVYGNWINPTGEKDDMFNWNVTMDPNRASGMAILEQIGGKAFLDNISAMSGTGPLSDAEGKKVAAAATRLMNVKQGDADALAAAQEYRKTVDSYRAALKQDMENIRKDEEARRQRMAAMMGAADRSTPASASGLSPDEMDELQRLREELGQ